MPIFKAVKPVFQIRQSFFHLIFFRVASALFILGVGLSSLRADPTSTDTPASTTSGSWILSAGGAVDFPHANWSPAYRVGIGSRAELNVPLGTNWATGLALGYFHYQGNDSSGPILIDELRVLPMLRFYPGSGNVSPYITGGAGLAAQFAAASGVITGNLNPDGFLGLGLEIHLADREALFVESNFSLMAAGATLQQDVDAVAGLRSGF
jgi:hypothetical protein